MNISERVMVMEAILAVMAFPAIGFLLGCALR